MTVTHYRRCIGIAGLDSPNVQLGLREQAAGRKASGRQIVPGVLSWDNFVYRTYQWGPPNWHEPQLYTESIEGKWYEGAEIRLVPDPWLKFAQEYAKTLDLKWPDRRRRPGRRWMGMDPGEGGDDSAWVVVDKLGVLHITSLKTPDTNSVYGRTCMLARRISRCLS